MGWSLPNIPIKESAPAWSPWICLLIIVAGVFVALIQVVMHSPVGGLPKLASGYWLPLTAYTLMGIAIAITLYLLWWEIHSYWVSNWNNWRRSSHLAWHYHAHQHLCVVRHTVLTADPQLFPRLAGGATEHQEDAPFLTLATNRPVIPGIYRFEQLCQPLIQQCKTWLIQRHPSGQVTVLIQTSSLDKEKEEEAFIRLWAAEGLPWTPTIKCLPDELLCHDWNQRLQASHSPVLVLALHYRQPEESLPEFACALMLVPESMLKPAERRDAVRVFRAMPLNMGALPRELAELRDMAQQPAGIKHLVWYSGLSASSAQALGRVINELPLPLHTDIASAGIIDFAKISADYGHLAGWLMVAAATEMVNYGPGSHWLLHADNKQGYAMALGNSLPVSRDEEMKLSPLPYPAGSLCLAILFNIAVFSAIAHFLPDWLFSSYGVLSMLLLLVVTLPGAVFLLRHSLASLQRPRFIQAARLARKE
ncbi:hypothetical protein LMA04_03280 [Pseudescherichia vulneris]|uniref:hypothetical protein n=1 Tax=Pseudescherichia vulneris TaxID=566 RepID=UPI00227A09F5|nr:hypothetical protein [Pseudescherichia vulneris]WAH53088.1 hypothetical protein LMA04_03280 [Pseudescherichia vulneris]